MTSSVIKLVRECRDSLARPKLTRQQAKLYSQRNRLLLSRPGLSSFQQSDIEQSLRDAESLITFALVLRTRNERSRWKPLIKRAAEILEWIAIQRNADDRPIAELAAAAYQVAGYPAMASGILSKRPNATAILTPFLRAEFRSCLDGIVEFWQNYSETTVDSSNVNHHVYVSVIRSLGLLCQYIANGDRERCELAIETLNAVARSSMGHADPTSTILAQLVYLTAIIYSRSAVWTVLPKNIDDEMVASVTRRFASAAYLNDRALVWAGQRRGIRKLWKEPSFALCTPTGTGKTLVAQLALLAELSRSIVKNDGAQLSSLGLYLVPSRALASEVERKLKSELGEISAGTVKVTGLYGGVDWGPTDVWIDADGPAVLVCTYEKAEALIRYLGPLIYPKLKVVIIDEAHQVQIDDTDSYPVEQIRKGESRPLRLESLVARLNLGRLQYHFRMIALSAVASGGEEDLSNWVSSGWGAPVKSTRRATRQMFGRIDVAKNSDMTIHYDLMDGHPLEFQEGSDGPYVPNPFPPFPKTKLNGDPGPLVAMRAYSLWGAMSIASMSQTQDNPSSNNGQPVVPRVLISLTQDPIAYIKTALSLLEEEWKDVAPDLLQDLSAEQKKVWDECLAVTADIFGKESIEYRMLAKGIVVHYGGLPLVMQREFNRAINAGIPRVIVATSTLSEGVNIPVTHILVPYMKRANGLLSTSEIRNLAGRAGRPGYATEGQILVLVSSAFQKSHFDPDFLHWKSALEEGTTEDSRESPLAVLMVMLFNYWSISTGSSKAKQFYEWLEGAAVPEDWGNLDKDATNLYRSLDNLDEVLIASLEESLGRASDDEQSIEIIMQKAWEATYAYIKSKNEAALNRIWRIRGDAITKLYPNAEKRKKGYQLGLSPRSANQLQEIMDDIISVLMDGLNYAVKNQSERFDFVARVAESVSSIDKFSIQKRIGRYSVDWKLALSWWLQGASSPNKPPVDRCSVWFDSVSRNFQYRVNWALGCVTSSKLLSMDEPLAPLRMDDWEKSGLPWIAFWIKELLSWGTLDPVAAYLLAKGKFKTRIEAETAAQAYYESGFAVPENPNALLDPRIIRKWVVETYPSGVDSEMIDMGKKFDVILERAAADYVSKEINVLPIQTANGIVWRDYAGYQLAKLVDIPANIQFSRTYNYRLYVDESIVVSTTYL